MRDNFDVFDMLRLQELVRAILDTFSWRLDDELVRSTAPRRSLA